LKVLKSVGGSGFLRVGVCIACAPIQLFNQMIHFCGSSCAIGCRSTRRTFGAVIVNW